jgi:hypothetical protein
VIELYNDLGTWKHCISNLQLHKSIPVTKDWALEQFCQENFAQHHSSVPKLPATTIGYIPYSAVWGNRKVKMNRSLVADTLARSTLQEI